MDTITELRLQNFQPHTDRQLPISDITVLVGPSDKGKSSILRAVRWLCLNTGSPATFIQRGKSNVAVTLKTEGVSADTPHTIVRQNGGKKNGYVLDGHEFNAIGKDIPPEVQSILNLIPDNFQTQHDYLYWFTESGSSLVKRIETTFGLTESADWAQAAKTETVRLEKEVKSVDLQIDSLSREIASLSVYREFEKAYQHLEALSAHVTKLQSARSRMIALSQTVQPIPTLPDDSVLARSEKHMQQKARVQRLTDLRFRYPAPISPFDPTAWLSQAESHLHSKDQAQRLGALHSQYPPDMPVVDEMCIGRSEKHVANKTKAARLWQLAVAHQSSRLPVIDAATLFISTENQIATKNRTGRLKTLHDAHVAMSSQWLQAMTAYNESETLIVSLTGQPCPTCGQPMPST